MSNIVLLAACILLGFGLRKSHRFPDAAPATLNAFIIHISLPALIVLQIHHIAMKPELLLSVAMPWMMFVLAVGFFYLLSRWLHFSRATTGALMLSGGLANTSFVGLPMIEAFFGRSNMGTGILIDQLGSYMVLNTLGIIIAALYSDGPTSASSVVRRIIVFPPLLALLTALALTPVDLPDWSTDILKRLADTLVPLALVSVGLQLRFEQVTDVKVALATGLSFKLLLAPAALALLYFGLLGSTDETSRVTLFEAAMGPHIGGSIVAVQHNLNPPLVSLMVGIGITLSFITLPAWSFLLHRL
jgi:malate permease and related proteins